MFFAATLALGSIQAASSQPVSVKPGVVIDFVHPVAFAASPTGSKVLVCTEDGSVKVIDAKTHQTLKVLAKHPGPAYAAAWSADGLYVATGDETARIFIENPVSGAKIREYRTHTKGIQKLSFNSTRQYLISTGKDDQINVYDLSKDSKKEARKILGKGANFYGATFSPTLPNLFATGILGPSDRCYDCVSSKELGFLTTGDDQGSFDVSFNPAGTRIVTADKNGQAVVFDAKTFKKLGTLNGHQDFVIYTAFSPNGKLIATSSTDRTVRIWNPYTLAKITELTGESSVGSPVCFTADGNTLLTVNDSGYLQFNSITPSQVGTDAPSVAKKTKKKRRHRRDNG